MPRLQTTRVISNATATPNHALSLGPLGATIAMRFHVVYWLTLIGAFLLAATGVFVNPGGPFISFIHSVVPAALLMLGLAHLLRGYATAGPGQRLVRILYAGFSTALLVLLVAGLYRLFMEPFNRGRLFGF